MNPAQHQPENAMHENERTMLGDFSRLAQGVARHAFRQLLGPAAPPVRTVCCELSELTSIERGLLGENVHECRCHPRVGQQASNNSEAQAFFVNGMGCNTEKLTVEAGAVTDLAGRSLRAIINGQASFAPREHLGAVAGLVSSDLGAMLESDTIQRIQDALVENHEAGRSSHIFCFSQGAIIVSNALELLKRKLGEEEWKRFSESVQVVAFGCPMRRWPSETKVLACSFTGDSPAALGRAFSELPAQVPLGGTKAIDIVKVDPQNPSLAHTVGEYMRELPRFVLAAFTSADGTLNEEGLASFVTRSIASGLISDAQHHELIRRIESKTSGAFRAALEAEAAAGALGRFQLSV